MTEDQKLKFIKRRAAIAIAICLVIAVLLLLSPIFAIRKVKAPKDGLCGDEELRDSLSAVIGTNGFIAVARQNSVSGTGRFFSLGMEKLENQLSFEYPYMRNVKVKYILPNTVSVSYDVRKEAFVTFSSGNYYLIDTTGYILDVYTSEDELPELPVLMGFTVTNDRPGMAAVSGKNESVDAGVKVCSMLVQLSMEHMISVVDVTDPDDIMIYCAPSLTVEIGSVENLGSKLSLLKGSLDKGLSGESNGVLNIKNGKMATYTANDN